MKHHCLTILAVAFSSASDAQVTQINVTQTERLRIVGSHAETVAHRGRTALKLVEAIPEANRANGPRGLAIIREFVFRNGVIELEIAGQPIAKASQDARGFVGIAFRLTRDGERYEYVYIRPSNGRAEDQVRRNHSLQYSAHPDYPWYRLRKEEPEKYESYSDLEVGAWTKIRLEIDGSKARLYLHGSNQPSLVVNDLKHGSGAAGQVALWVGPEAEGYFTNLRIDAR